MQLRDPSEGLGRKAFAHTEAVQTDFTQVSAGWGGFLCKFANAFEGPFRRIGRKAFAQTEAVQTDSTQVSDG